MTEPTDPVSARLRAVMLVNDRIYDGDFRGNITYEGTDGGDHIVSLLDRKYGRRTFEVDLVTTRVTERQDEPPAPE